MSDVFSVQIVARGEGLDYTDDDGIFRFDIGRIRSTVQFDPYFCSDEAFQPRRLSDEQRLRIIPRIVAHLQSYGTQVTVPSEAPSQPLRSGDDILQERFRERSGQQPESK
jgi:hypothetical protein